MMSKYAQISEINGGLVFSDPHYDENVWCQYREAFSAKDWLIKFDTEVEGGIINFNMYIGRPTMCSSVVVEDKDGALNVSYPTRYSIDSYELGIDTARIFCGTKANWDLYREEAAVYTGADGLFGNLMVFRCQGESAPAGFLLLGAVDAELTSEQELYRELCSSFDGLDISREQFAEKCSASTLSYKMLLASEYNSQRDYAEKTGKDNSHKPKENEI